jgi:hypothetical protein
MTDVISTTRTVHYNGPARFLGYQGKEFKTDKILEVTTLVGDTMESTFSCVQCGYVSEKYQSVRAHLSSHVRKGETPKRGTSQRRDYSLDAIVERRIEKETGALRKERDALRKENRMLRSRLNALRKALVD